MNKKILLLALSYFGKVSGSSYQTPIQCAKSLSLERIDKEFYKAVNIATGKYLKTNTFSLDFLDREPLTKEDGDDEIKGRNWIVKNLTELPLLYFYDNSPNTLFENLMEECHTTKNLKQNEAFRTAVTWVITKIQEIVEDPNHEMKGREVICIRKNLVK